MLQDPNCQFSLLQLPQLVVDKILSRLDFNDCKKLKLVCLTTNSWINDSKFHEKCELRLQGNDDIDELIHNYTSIKTFNFVNEDFPNFPSFSKFLQIYGQQIRHLSLKNYPFRPLDLNFISSCVDLQSLEFRGMWPVSSFFPDPSWDFNLTNIFKQISHISCNLSCEGLAAEKLSKFNDFLKLFESLETLRLNVHYTNHQYFLRQMVSHLRNRFPHVAKNLVTEDEVKDFLMQSTGTELFPNISKFCEFTHEVGFKFCEFQIRKSRSLEEGFLSLVTGLKTGHLGHTVLSFPFNLMSNLEEIKIHMSKFDFPFDISAGISGNVFRKLEKVHICLTKDFLLTELERAKWLFGFPGNKSLWRMSLEFSIPISEPDKTRDEGISGFIKSFKYLKHLSFVNSFCPEWTTEVEDVRSLEFIEVDLKGEDLNGNGEGHRNSILRFQGLRDLRIRNLSRPNRLTDFSFKTLICQLRLKTFCIHGLMPMITRNGFESLKSGPFSQTVERFPYPWGFAEEDRDWIPDTALPLYSRIEFRHFQEAFKFLSY